MVDQKQIYYGADYNPEQWSQETIKGRHALNERSWSQLCQHQYFWLGKHSTK